MSTAPIMTRRAKILRDFKDAGDERRFTAGETVEISDGAFANYEAAGLVEAAGRRSRAG